MVLGASGSGKSSLVMAGILPKLRKFPDHWIILDPFRPGRDPFGELAISIENAYHEIKDNKVSENFTSTIIKEKLIADALKAVNENNKNNSYDLFQPESSESTLNNIVSELRLLSKNQRHSKVLIVIDQFEELIGHKRTYKSHDLFLNLLNKSLSEEESPCMVLASMRSDFMGSFQQTITLRNIEFESISLRPMKIESLREIIERPAKMSAIILEKGLSDRLIRDTETSDALPLLAFTLRKLWNDYREDGVLQIREYDDLGGLQGAITKEADIVLDIARKRGKEDALRLAFLKMARIGEDGMYSRQPASMEDPQLHEVSDILEKFKERRLIFSYAEGSSTIVEVAHESMFRSWEPLKRWLDDDRSELVLRQQLSRDSKAWLTEGKATDRLWTGARLERAKELSESTYLKKNESDFVHSGIKRKRRQQRRRRIIASSIIVILSLLSLFLVITLTSLQKANNGTANFLLGSIDKNILDLDYHSALENAIALVTLGAKSNETARCIQEIAYFYTESNQLKKADSSLQVLKIFTQDLQYASLRKAVKKVNPTYFDVLEIRYYPEMVLVAGGDYKMGREKYDNEEEADGLPIHDVKVDSFYMSTMETTAWQFNLFVKANRRDILIWGGIGNEPVNNVSWYDALFYLNWLSKKMELQLVYDLDMNITDPNTLDSLNVDWQKIPNWNALGYRLPTEAEWEYAARGGLRWEDQFIYSGGNNLDILGWYHENSENKTHPAGSKIANQLGLYDMSGGLWEWCWDWYGGNYYEDSPIDLPKGPQTGEFRILRGGSWYSNDYYCQSKFRSGNVPALRYFYNGFRCAKSL